MMKCYLWRLALLVSCAVVVLPAQAAGQSEPPRLIVQITVDALRGDLPSRYLSEMGPGGFRYLMEKGVHYTNAHYQHANTETIVGHASLATGSMPAAFNVSASPMPDTCNRCGELKALAAMITSRRAWAVLMLRPF